MSEKLQKVLARTGLGSRRTMEMWIAGARVRVNGAVARLGDRVTPADHITVDGKPLKLFPAPATRRVLLYHKPIGEICTRQDPQGRPTVYGQLPSLSQGRWTAVGRLDINTAGLLLFTTDGELAHRLMHPSFAQEREYAVRVLGSVTSEIICQLLQGVALPDGLARFKAVEEMEGRGANRWYRVTVTAGRHRLVRRVWESQGLQVSRLIRIRYGNILLPRALRPGKFAELNEAEIKQLLQDVGLT